MNRFYRELAAWWPLLSHPDDYREEADWMWSAMCRASRRPIRTVLELGCGGGNNAVHLKSRCRLVLCDLSPEMLAVSRALNPECEHMAGDMRTLRLGRAFDAVYVHDAISYMTTEADLRAAIGTCAAHTAPGGVTMLQPDDVAETYVARTDHGGHDHPDGRGLRYLEWAHEPQAGGTVVPVDFAFLLREADGSLRVEHDRHECGLFPRATWLALLREAGFQAVESVVDPWEREVFFGRH
jgi:SAM-dependent methyltransferase